MRYKKNASKAFLAPLILIPTEYQECKAYWEWAKHHPLLSEYLIKHTNENRSGAWFVKSLIAIGMRPGIPDYQYPVANLNWNGLWIEMKSRDMKGKKNRQNQQDWIEKLKKLRHYATYAYGCDEAIQITTDYMDNKI